MPITDLRYLKEKNVESYRRVIKDQYRQLIYSYGINVQYFRKNNNLFNPDVQLTNYIYGEDTTSEFSLSAEMVLFMAVNEYELLTNKFGIETNANGDCYILIDDFHEQFRDLLGATHNTLYTTNIELTIISGNISITNDIIGVDLSGYNNFDLSFSTSGSYIDTLSTTEFTRYPLPHNKDLYWTHYYNNQEVNGNTIFSYNAIVDNNLNGTLFGNINNNFNYFVKIPKNEPKDWGITPQPGDIFRIQFHDPLKPNQEYEITEVKNKQITPDGLNPLLDTYIWRLSVVKRVASHEIINSDLQEELPIDQKEVLSQYIEREADKVFDYTIKVVDKIDGVNSDDIYGSYSRKIYGAEPPPPTPANPTTPLPTPIAPALIDNTIDQFITDENIGIFKFVQFNTNGNIILANSTNITNIIGITTSAASAGNTINVKSNNLITSNTFNLIPNTNIFLTTNGNFTQTLPITGNIHTIGVAVSTTSIQLNTDYDVIIG